MDSDGLVAGALLRPARVGLGGVLRGAAPDPRVRLRQRWPIGQWLVGAAVVLLLADGAASLLLPAPAPAVAAVPQAVAPSRGPAAWVDIAAPLRLYGLAGSPYAKLPLAYEARRNGTGEERQDVLTFGVFGGASPFFRLAIARRGEAPAPAARRPDLLVDLARVAAASGLAVTRIGLPLNQMSRFGLFDTAEVTLAREASAVPCVGFRLAETAQVDMAGLACGGENTPLDRSALGCVLDRIDLLTAGEDNVLRDFFVAAERRRGTGCAATGRRLTGLR